MFKIDGHNPGTVLKAGNQKQTEGLVTPSTNLRFVFIYCGTFTARSNTFSLVAKVINCCTT